MIKRLFLFTMLACGLWACSDDENNPDPVPVGEAFTEGHIRAQISLPDNPFFEMMQHIDYTAEDAEEQAKEYYNNLTPEEQEEFMAFEETIEGSGNNTEGIAYMLSLLFLPLQGTDIYVRDDETTAKFDALTYHGENWIDMEEEGGLMYMESQSDPEKRITYTYRADAVYESYSQVHVSDEFYHIEKTGETELIAGYPCIKKVYTLINPSNNPAGAKLEVWTSEQMPVSLNFMHPYYLEEDGGVMKIVVYPTADEKYPTEYLFVNVTPREVSDEEMAVQRVEPVYDYESDLETIGQKILEIMFGG